MRLQAVVQDMISGHLLPPAEAVCPSQTPSCVDELSRRAAEIVEIQVHQPKLVLMLNRLPSYEAYRAFFVEGDEERALTIDPAITVRVLLYRAGDSYNLGDHEGAAESVRAFLEEFRSALTEFGTTMCRGGLAFYEGDIQLALTHDRRASELEPSDLMARGSLWDSAIWANRPYEAVAPFEGIAPCDNGFGWKVPIALLGAGDFEGALEAARTYHACFPQWREMDDKAVITSCAILAARRGDRSEAERFEALIGADDQTHAEQSNNTYNRMCIAAQLGDAERAIDLLRQFIALGGGSRLELIRRDPDLAPLREVPAFQELTRPKG